MQCLGKYGLVSGYKVNENKSEAMMISDTLPSQLNEVVSFHWSKPGFTYIGIILTPNPNQLFEANHYKLIKQIKYDIARWKILPLSLLGRFEGIRMNLLTRFLFSFQSLVPISVFNVLDKWIRTCVSAKKEKEKNLGQNVKGFRGPESISRATSR